MAFSMKESMKGVLGSVSAIRQAIFPSYLGIDIGTTSIKIVETKYPDYVIEYSMVE